MFIKRFVFQLYAKPNFIILSTRLFWPITFEIAEKLNIFSHGRVTCFFKGVGIFKHRIFHENA